MKLTHARSSLTEMARRHPLATVAYYGPDDQRATNSAGLPRPEIEDGGGCVTVRFRPTGYVPPQRVATSLTERQRQVLAHLAGSPSGAAVREIAAALGLSDSPWTIREDLAALKTLGVVRSSGWGRGARWVLAGQ